MVLQSVRTKVWKLQPDMLWKFPSDNPENLFTKLVMSKERNKVHWRGRGIEPLILIGQ